jgi:Protein of unknown function (DUF3467)
MDEVPDLYVNSVRIAAGPYDFTFEFGSSNPTIDLARPAGIRDLARIRMSPQHALVFMRVLQDALEKYQRQIAPIQIPPEILGNMGIEP